MNKTTFTELRYFDKSLTCSEGCFNLHPESLGFGNSYRNNRLKMKKAISIIVCLMTSILVHAQLNEVSLVVTGEGATKEAATNNALRSAVEQAFGVFVSANTEILNDEIVKDEIATISSGNVKSFKEISVMDIAGDRKSITLEAVVSIGNLIEYSKVHGAQAEFAGAVFGANLRLRELRKRNEREVISSQISLLNSVRDQLFQANIKVGNPTMKRVNSFRYDPEKNDWRGEGCEASLYYQGLLLLGESKRLVKFPVFFECSLGSSTKAYDKSYVLPIQLYFHATPQGKKTIKEFLKVIGSISLSVREKQEYDAENILYYTVNWINGGRLYFRDFCSVIVLSELVRIINRSFIDDWTILIKTGGATEEITQKTNPSLFSMEPLRLFGHPCSPLIEYYVWRLNNKTIAGKDIYVGGYTYRSTSSFPRLHCDIDENGRAIQFTSSDNKDVIDKKHASFIIDMLREMYGGDKEDIETQSDELIIHNDFITGKTIRSLGDLDGKLALIRKDPSSPIDIVDIQEMPVNFDGLGSFRSIAIYDILTDQTNIIYKYGIELPIEESLLINVTGIEVKQKNN